MYDSRPQFGYLADNGTSKCGFNIGTTCPPLPQDIHGQRDVVAILRLVVSILGILGAASIIFSALCRRRVCNPKVHPIFVLSLADLMLGVLWVSGAVVWIGGGLSHHHNLRVGCFTINLMTVILECVVVNLTLLYALLAYSSLKQRDFSGVYMVQERPISLHVWHPCRSFLAYFIAWTLPVVLIMIPFGALSSKYGIVHDANDCSCWCIPYFGNVIPFAYDSNPNNTALLHYDLALRGFITTYALVMTLNYLVVFICLVVIYCKILRRIRRMRQYQARNQGTHNLYGATEAMIVKGQKQAKTRVLLFLTIFLLSGIFTCMLAGYNLVIAIKELNREHGEHPHWRKDMYTFLLLEALFVPLQGFLNAIVYGWTREDFLDVMASNRSREGQDSFVLSHEEEDEEEMEGTDSGHVDRHGNSILFLSTSQEGEGGQSHPVTPNSPAPRLDRRVGWEIQDTH